MSLHSSWLKRYCHEALAWEYDYRHNKLAPGELEWYLKYARLTGGPILELACGTGRLLIWGDMLRDAPPIRYPLAILAYNSLQELETPTDCGLLFKRVHGCLRAGGYFLLMVVRAYP